jgi:O-antigen/teichoic acid export membrane protein
MSKGKVIISNFILIFTSNVIGQLFFLGGLVHLARTFGPVGFGLWNFVQAWLTYFFRAGEMGLEVIGVREIARHPESTPRLITAVVASRFILLCVLVIILFIVIFFGLIPADTVSLMIIFSLSLIPMVFILEWVFEGHQNLFNVSIARIAKGVIFFLLIVLFIKSDYEINLSAFIYVVSITLPLIYIGFLALRRFGHKNIRDVFPIFPYLWKSALPVGFATLLSQYSLFLGTIIIGYTLQRDQLGYFTASHRIVIFLWAYVIANLQRVVLPTLSNYYQTSTFSYQSFVEKFFHYVTPLSFGIGLLIVSLSQFIIRILFSDRFNPSIPILQILVMAFVMASIRAILEIALLASDKQKIYFLGMIFLAVLYSIFTPWLVHLYGINGAAYAALIAETSYLIALVVLWTHECNSKIWIIVVKSCVAAVIAITSLFLPYLNPVSRIPVAYGIYIGILLIAKTINKSELIEAAALLKNIIKRK